MKCRKGSGGTEPLGGGKTGLPGGGSACEGAGSGKGGSGRQDQVMGSLQYPAQEFGFYSVAGGEDRGL